MTHEQESALESLSRHVRKGDPVPSKLELLRLLHYCESSAAKPRVYGRQITCADDAKDAFQCIASLGHEELWALALDSKGHVLDFIQVSKGGVHGCSTKPRDVFAPLILVGAVAFILGHNHPSGDLTPSAEDTDLTRAYVKVGGVVGIKLLDHLILTSNAYHCIDLG